MVLYDELPTVVLVDGERYGIITDFREWIRFADLAETEDIVAINKIDLCLQWYLDNRPRDVSKAIDALITFFQCKNPDDDTGTDAAKKVTGHVPVFSYSYDAEVIYADFIRVYGIDLLDISYMHWWKFRALLNNLPESCGFKQRIYYRTVNLADIDDKKERARISKIRRTIALPTRTLTDDDIGNAFW